MPIFGTENTKNSYWLDKINFGGFDSFIAAKFNKKIYLVYKKYLKNA